MLGFTDQFDDRRIRREQKDGVTVYSLVDIMAVFSDTEAARQYWVDTKKRLKADGFQLSDKISQLKLTSSDGKKYKTDVADAETCLRIVQSIPSPKAEPVRAWLAKVAYDRLQEQADPELGMERAQDRAVETYKRRGKDDNWIATRIGAINDRKVFTDALSQHVTNIQGRDYGIATNAMYKGLWDRDANTLKKELGLSGSANLRDYQPRIAAHYQALCEMTVASILGKSETVAPEQAMTIIRHVSKMFGFQASELGTLLGIDPATGKPMLQDGGR